MIAADRFLARSSDREHWLFMRDQGVTAKGNIPVRYLGAKKLYDRADLDRFFEALPPERT